MNPKHVEIVRQGEEAINAWHHRHVGNRLELWGANLFGANLSKTDLSYADLSEANLAGANLAGANLYRADLYEADLSHANLFGANLAGASLAQTRLVESHLAEAILYSALFARADLEGCDFKGANFGFTVLAGCDLSLVLGLGAVRHTVPSTIGLNTIVRSGGNIPEVFLRGAGVPDSIITYTRSLVAEPIQFYTCFISYSAADQVFADRLYADLQARGVRCWLYAKDAVMGRRVWEDIDRSIRVYDKLVVICSQSSLTSPAVLDEIERSLSKEDAIARKNAERMKAAEPGVEPRLNDPDVLFPIRIDDYVFEGWKHHRRGDVISRTIGDFIDWDKDVDKYSASLARLLHALDPKSWPAMD